VIHFTNKMMCSEETFSASPGWRSMPLIACETELSAGANCHVTRPGAGRPHAHDTKPEQSLR